MTILINHISVKVIEYRNLKSFVFYAQVTELRKIINAFAHKIM